MFVRVNARFSTLNVHLLLQTCVYFVNSPFFLQKSCPTRKRVGAGVYAGNVMATAVCETAGARRGQYGNGGVQAAAAWRLLMDQMDQMDQMDNVGAP